MITPKNTKAEKDALLFESMDVLSAAATAEAYEAAKADIATKTQETEQRAAEFLERFQVHASAQARREAAITAAHEALTRAEADLIEYERATATLSENLPEIVSRTELTADMTRLGAARTSLREVLPLVRASFAETRSDTHTLAEIR